MAKPPDRQCPSRGANLIAEATSDEDMFPVSTRGILNWKSVYPDQSEWMSNDNIAYIIRRGKQYDLEQSTINKMRRNALGEMQRKGSLKSQIISRL